MHYTRITLFIVFLCGVGSRMLFGGKKTVLQEDLREVGLSQSAGLNVGQGTECAQAHPRNPHETNRTNLRT